MLRFILSFHDDVIKWKHFPCYWWIPLPRASDAELWFFSLICAWINGWVNSPDAGDLRRHRADYDVTVMFNFNFHYDQAIPPGIVATYTQGTDDQPISVLGPQKKFELRNRFWSLICNSLLIVAVRFTGVFSCGFCPTPFRYLTLWVLFITHATRLHSPDGMAIKPYQPPLPSRFHLHVITLRLLFVGA